LRQGFRSFKDFFRYVGLKNNALDDAGAVAEFDKLEFAFACGVVNPAVKRYFLSDGFGKPFNGLE
jgi:hypothetical protein